MKLTKRRASNINNKTKQTKKNKNNNKTKNKNKKPRPVLVKKSKIITLNGLAILTYFLERVAIPHNL